MNSTYSEQQLKDLKALFYIRPLFNPDTRETAGSLCGCCGSIRSYHINTMTVPIRGRIGHSVYTPETIYNIRDGWDGLVIPDAACNVILEWEKQP